MSYNGRVPIAGCVTSRRDHGDPSKLEKQKFLRQKQEEAERALKQSQAEVLQYMKDKSKHRSAEEEGGGASSHHEKRRRRSEERTRRSRSRSIKRERSRQRSRPHSRPRESWEVEESKRLPCKEEFSSYVRRDTGMEERRSTDGGEPAESFLSRPRRFTERDAAGEHLEQQGTNAPSELLPHGSDSFQRGTRRQSSSPSRINHPMRMTEGREIKEPPPPPSPVEPCPPLPASSWNVIERQASSVPSSGSSSSAAADFFKTEVCRQDTREQAAERKRVQEEKERRKVQENSRKSKLASAFGFEDDDEEDVQKELAAVAKKKKTQMQDDTPSSFPSAMAASVPPEMDMFTALKKMADFKRSCSGAPRPMPPELQAMASAMFGQGRVTNPGPPGRRD